MKCHLVRFNRPCLSSPTTADWCFSGASVWGVCGIELFISSVSLKASMYMIQNVLVPIKNEHAYWHSRGKCREVPPLFTELWQWPGTGSNCHKSVFDILCFSSWGCQDINFLTSMQPKLDDFLSTYLSSLFAFILPFNWSLLVWWHRQSRVGRCIVKTNGLDFRA